MDAEYARGLVDELRALPRESSYVEFKRNKADSKSIGQYISALSNSAVLHDLSYGYLVWGIDDDTHEVVGTSFDPRASRVGNEDLLP